MKRACKSMVRTPQMPRIFPCLWQMSRTHRTSARRKLRVAGADRAAPEGHEPGVPHEVAGVLSRFDIRRDNSHRTIVEHLGSDRRIA